MTIPRCTVVRMLRSGRSTPRSGGLTSREDTLITDHSAGVRFDRLVKDDFFRLSDGTGKVTVHQFDMHTSSTNPVVGTEAEGQGQHVTVKTVNIGHDTDFLSW